MWPVPPYRSFSGRRPDVAASRGPSDYSCSVAGEFLDAACVGDGAPPSTPTQAPLRGKERQRVLQMGKDAHVLIDMVRVPAHGPVEETMVDRRTGRVWTVEVSPFEVATTVVTVAQWNATLGGVTEPSHADLPKVEVSWRHAVSFCNELSLRGGLTPAYTITAVDPPTPGHSTWTPHDEAAPDDWHVSWDRGANGYRLLTDAEWQVACRAGSTGPRYGALDDIAWYAGNSRGSLRPVRQKQPNAWGLSDTLGGVWEWCWDHYDVDAYGSYRIIRGGGWSDPHWSCRVGVRRKTSPQAALDDLGLRLARSLTARGGAWAG